MNNARFGAWNHFGFSYKHTTAITAVRQFLLVTKDDTNAPQSDYVPVDCNLESITVLLDTIVAPAASLDISIWRDSAGSKLLVSEFTAPITTGAIATNGGVHAKIDLDHHYLEGLSTLNTTDTTKVNLYIGINTDAGTANAKIMLNWRW